MKIGIKEAVNLSQDIRGVPLTRASLYLLKKRGICKKDGKHWFFDSDDLKKYLIEVKTGRPSNSLEITE